DRALLDATCDHLLVLDGEGNVQAFLGTYSQWAEKQTRSTASDAKVREPKRAVEPAPKPAPPAPSKKSEADRPRKSKWSWMRVEQLEEKIGFFEEQVAEIDKQLADPDVWLDHERAGKLTDQRDEIKAELDLLEAEWLYKAE
ncbi:MAG: hypothetical protein CMJ31_02055, partial [Phycisphaerae bacterium]|nr:hypothetical protein [Phycisphaerae bacterium]